MNLNGIHHVAIICSDYYKSKEFYTRVLGLKIINEFFREGRDSYKLDLAVGGNYQIELFSFPNAPERPSYPEARGLRHIAFEVDNLEDIVAELLEKGIKSEEIRLDEITGKRFLFILDPDDLPIEFYEK